MVIPRLMGKRREIIFFLARGRTIGRFSRKTDAERGFREMPIS
jgi:hypothetical protein